MKSGSRKTVLSSFGAMEMLAWPGPQGNQGISRKFFRDAFSIFILNVQRLLPEGRRMTDIEEVRLEMPNWKLMVQVNTLALESNSFIHSLTHPFIHSTDRN